MPTDIFLPENGWLTPAEASALQAECQGLVVLEVGAWAGRSTVAIAQVARHVVSVDHHRGSTEHGPGVNTLAEFMGNLRRFHIDDKVSTMVMDAENVGDFLRPGAFDIAFIDGAHDFESVARDGVAARRLTRSGPVLFHDYGPGWPEVARAVDAMARAWRVPVQRLSGTLVRLAR